jgi:hypothetical protein
MAVSKRLRYEILRRDSNTCRYCGQSAPDVTLTVDHVVPTALGGSDDPSNLVAACKDCNAGKSASAPDAAIVADVDQRAVRWAQAMNVVLEQRAAEHAADRKRIAKFDRKWRSYVICGGEYQRDVNWKNSITRFLAGGLDDQFIADAVDTAMGRTRIPVADVWRYFCGICWRELEDIAKRTTALLDDSSAPEAAEPPSSCKRCGDFDYMGVFERFLEHVVAALGGTEEVDKFVSWQLWDSMPAAHKAWRETLKNPGDFDPEEESPEGLALDAGLEEISNQTANAMYELRKWRESRDRSLRAVGGDSDGA